MFDEIVNAVSVAASLPGDRVRCLLALFASYPLSLPLQWHPSRTVDSVTGRVDPAPAWAVRAKHAYIVVVAALLVRFCFQDLHDLANLALLPLITYGIVAHGVRTGRNYVGAVWAAVLLHMSYGHLRRQYYDYGGYSFDWTAPAMVLVIKLTQFAWAVHDQRRVDLEEDLEKKSSLSDHERRMAATMPGPLEFAAFVYFPAGLLVGPAFELADFRRFISGDVFLPPPQQLLQQKEKEESLARARSDSATEAGSGFDMDDSDAEHQGFSPVKSSGSVKEKTVVPVVMPSPLLPALRCFATALLFMGGVVVLGDRFSYARLLTPAYLAVPLPVAAADSVMSATWVVAKRFMRLQVAGFAARHSYYAVWKLAEGACIVAGLGYTSGGTWDQVTNVRIGALESAQSFKGVIDNWNIGTANWLKYSVYLRLAPSGKPTPLTTVLTYSVSSLWHGFYTGYYLTFVSGAFVTETAKTLRRTLRPRAVAAGPLAKRAYDVGGWILTQGILNYVVAPFMLLSWSDSVAVWRANYFVGHFAMVVAVAACAVLGRPPRSMTATATPVVAKVSSSPMAAAAPFATGNVFLSGAAPEFTIDREAVRRAAAERVASVSPPPGGRRRGGSPRAARVVL